MTGGPVNICIANQKGGAGKTTVATGLAAAIGADGYRVLLLDADTKQPEGNARGWHWTLFERHAPEGVSPFDVYSDDPAAAEAAMSVIRRVGYECLSFDDLDTLDLDVNPWDHVVVDCPPGDPDRIVQMLRLADAAIIPMSPTNADVGGVRTMQHLIDAIERPLAARVLVNRYDQRKRKAAEVIAALDQSGVRRFRTIVPDRAEIADTFGEAHPSTSFAGWVAWRDLWWEITQADSAVPSLGLVSA